jgi:nitrite reductase (cytochrome c-552)
MTEPKNAADTPKYLGKVFVLLVIIGSCAALGVVGIAGLLVTIFTHKQEAKDPFFRVAELSEDVSDPEVWGRNFPYQYDLYLRTVDMKRTRFGGSEAFPRTPSDMDPRESVTRSVLDQEPRLRDFWAGYAFSVDYREKRGHAFMLEDQSFTERQRVVRQPGTCLNCHASMVGPYRKAGGGDMDKGFAAINAMPYTEARKFAERAIACIDCHNPETMELRITRPAFIEGIKAHKASQGIKDFDVNRDATHQEMRSYVCGQCHVEYYFKGDGKTLTYPWAKGLKADEMLDYYDEIGFTDWTHKISGTPCVKAQHPEFELWNQGVHARAGVSCADCHMPYVRVGAQKVSDHHVNSPLLKIASSCQTCHRVPEAELRARAENIQEKTDSLEKLALGAVVALIQEIQKGVQNGTPQEKIDQARRFHRRAQFLTDFVFSENSLGFHASQESARLLALAIDYARQGQMALAGQ